MSSIIKVNTFQDANGNALFNSDGSGNVTLSSNDMKMTPAFWVALSGSDQSIANDISTKIQYNTTTLDTDSDWDATNYRFTPSVSGYYFVYAKWRLGATNNTDQIKCLIKKNGSDLALSSNENNTQQTAQASSLVQMNGSTDYIEVYAYHTTGASEVIKAQTQYTVFQGFKIIGA